MSRTKEGEKRIKMHLAPVLLATLGMEKGKGIVTRPL